MYLTRALKCGINTTSEHEMKPTTVHFPSVLRRGLSATYSMRQRDKLASFVQWVEETGDNSIADITHMFMKSWADVALDWLLADPRFDVHIIVLRRWLPLVVRSYLIVDVWRTNTMLMYNGGEYTAHHDKFSLLPAIKEYQDEDSIDLIMGYLVDIELQLARMRAAYAGRVTFHDIRAEDLFAPGGVRRLLYQLNLVPNERMLAAIATTTPVNQHVSWRAPEMFNTSNEIFDARARRFLRAYRAKGIELPPMPHLVELVQCSDAGVSFEAATRANGLTAVAAAAAAACGAEGKKCATDDKAAILAAAGGLSSIHVPAEALTAGQAAFGIDVLGTAATALVSAAESHGDIAPGTPLPMLLAGSSGTALGSALFGEYDANMFCPLPYPKLTDKEIDDMLEGVEIPRNRGPTPKKDWQEQHLKEINIFACVRATAVVGTRSNKILQSWTHFNLLSPPHPPLCRTRPFAPTHAPSPHRAVA